MVVQLTEVFYRLPMITDKAVVATKAKELLFERAFTYQVTLLHSQNDPTILTIHTRTSWRVNILATLT